jgi:hypothetical protein
MVFPFSPEYLRARGPASSQSIVRCNKQMERREDVRYPVMPHSLLVILLALVPYSEEDYRAAGLDFKQRHVSREVARAPARLPRFTGAAQCDSFPVEPQSEREYHLAVPAAV